MKVEMLPGTPVEINGNRGITDYTDPLEQKKP